MINTVEALTSDYLTVDDSAVITGNLAVSSFANIGDRLTVRSDGFNGSMRCIPLVAASEPSIKFYKYRHVRSSNADDMWLMGQTSWFNGGYSIGTPGLGMCLNIPAFGSVKAPYKIITPLIYTDRILGNGAAQITIDDNVILTGN